MVDFLLSKGADIDAQTDKGETALRLDSDRGHTEIVELLLGKGATPLGDAL